MANECGSGSSAQASSWLNGALGLGAVVVAAGNSAGDAANATPANRHGVTTVAAANRSGGKAHWAFPLACSGCGTGLLDAGLAVAAAAAAPAVVLANVAGVEPNNSGSTAQVISGTLVQVAGSLSSSSDLDFFRVSLLVGKTLTALLKPNAGANFNLTLYNAAGAALATSTNAGNGVADSFVYCNNGSAAVSVLVAVRYGSSCLGSCCLKLSQ